LLHRNDKFVVGYNKSSKILALTSNQFATRSSDLIITFVYAGNRIQIGSEQFVSCIELFILQTCVFIKPHK